VSRLEDAINAGRFVVTAELLTVNAGGLDAVHERFAPFRERRAELTREQIDEILAAGAVRAGELAEKTMVEVRNAIGLPPYSQV